MDNLTPLQAILGFIPILIIAFLGGYLAAGVGGFLVVGWWIVCAVVGYWYGGVIRRAIYGRH